MPAHCAICYLIHVLIAVLSAVQGVHCIEFLSQRWIVAQLMPCLLPVKLQILFIACLLLTNHVPLTVQCGHDTLFKAKQRQQRGEQRRIGHVHRVCHVLVTSCQPGPVSVSRPLARIGSRCREPISDKLHEGLLCVQVSQSRRISAVTRIVLPVIRAPL